MEQRYVIRTNDGFSQPMTREQAIKMVKEYDKQGISAYIVSEEEGERIKKNKFNKPTWS
ncbi:hypothetical protein [Caldisalinibacter kiritimatiensis]|uniref:Uncharacterized protein n=1 Tax=Caldisalinibacter kiritimatiensis TaxID=1304284 RepID=R1AXN1_9FIRM|nr:hypothetical protein [Caldisalinibacter kiritimatiensis]EOD01412.1 hypothetical protein L21TH_0517 [Caldisalinibacter kiritimatiensis]